MDLPDPDAVPLGGEVPTIALNPDDTNTYGTYGDDIIYCDENSPDRVDLRAGKENDVLRDGGGAGDTLRGGQGRDIFRFVEVGQEDRIHDFEVGDFDGKYERGDLSATDVDAFEDLTFDKIDLSGLGVTEPADINDWVTIDTVWTETNPVKGRMFLYINTEGDGVSDTRIRLNWDDKKIDLHDEATGLVMFDAGDCIFA